MGLFIATIRFAVIIQWIDYFWPIKKPVFRTLVLSPEPYPLESLNGEKQRLDQIRAAYYRVKIEGRQEGALLFV